MTAAAASPAGRPDTARPETRVRGAVVARITGGVLYVAEPSDPSWAQGPRDPWLTTAQVAEITQMSPATWRSQVRRGYAPKADDPGDLDVSPRRRNPRWRRSTVALYLAKRRPRLKKPQAESAQ